MIHAPANTEVTFSSRGFRYTPGRLTCDQPLEGFIREAYSIRRSWQISGPEWIHFEKYEFTATMPDDTTKETARLMLQTMLAERFGLKLHHGQKETPVYALIVGKGGPKLAEVTNPTIHDNSSAPGRFGASAMSIDSLANQLSLIADRPVVDMTGIKGFYKIDMKWTPDWEVEPGGSRRIDKGILAVLEEQLGLRLQPQKVPVEIFVIDHVERRPTPN